MIDSRAEHERHLDCIVDAMGELNEKLRIMQYERDIERAWLEGWEARNMMTERCPEAGACTVSCMVDGISRRHCRVHKDALDRLRSYASISLASKAVGPAGLALSEDGAPEQDGAPPEEYWDYL